MRFYVDVEVKRKPAHVAVRPMRRVDHTNVAEAGPGTGRMGHTQRERTFRQVMKPSSMRESKQRVHIAPYDM